MEIVFTEAHSSGDLMGILDLQTLNHVSNIGGDTAKEQGFVTVRHDFTTLSAMNKEFRHVVAKQDDRIVGYALVMLKEFGKNIPELISMFEEIENIQYNNMPLGKLSYFVMGQVCVASEVRGMNVFASLYGKLKQNMAPHFDYIVTEIAERNTRSMRAHSKIGFTTIHSYTEDLGERWNVVLLPTHG